MVGRRRSGRSGSGGATPATTVRRTRPADEAPWPQGSPISEGPSTTLHGDLSEARVRHGVRPRRVKGSSPPRSPTPVRSPSARRRVNRGARAGSGKAAIPEEQVVRGRADEHASKPTASRTGRFPTACRAFERRSWSARRRLVSRAAGAHSAAARRWPTSAGRRRPGGSSRSAKAARPARRRRHSSASDAEKRLRRRRSARG